MTCNACGEKPKNTAKDFTKAVIEINNPEMLVLLRKVVIPASMGTEEDVPASVGKYRNVILYYEVNKHTYLYSSDGIPTLLETEIPQEVLDKIDQLEDGLEQEIAMREGMDEELQSNIDAVAQDLEDFKNSPDVVDIVSTYAALQAYDTSRLGDNDEIRVLTDETHDGASAYYRWDKTNSQWIFIGITGPYYTKSEIDTTVQSIDNDIDDLRSEIGKAKILTQEDYNYPADNPNSIALWLLDPGMYVVSQGVSAKVSNDSVAENTLYIVTALGTYGKAILNFTAHNSEQTGPYYGTIYTVSSAGAEFDNRPLTSVIDALDSTYTKRALSANQGRVLNEKIGDLTTLTTTDKTNTVAAINEIASGLPPVVQTTGASTTDVMSQAATTSMVYPNYQYHPDRIRIGENAGSSDAGTVALGNGAMATNTSALAIGARAHAYGDRSIAIGGAYSGTGTMPVANSNYGIAIGHTARAGISLAGEQADYAVALGASSSVGAAGDVRYSVALGAYSLATQKGQVDISTLNAGASNTHGYNNSEYRLLTGLYDPQSSHDAATKGYVDNSVPATFTTNEWNALWA